VSVDARDGYTVDARDEMQNGKSQCKADVCIVRFAL
jgi:hypothetical protein